MSAFDPLADTSGPVLVIAPHPDDEALGCGGLMALAAQAGRRVHTVFITDGGASHPHSASWSRERLAAQRAGEAREALARLGLGHEDASFLHLRDADMPATGTPERAAAARDLAAIVTQFAPGLALLPWRRDPHRDHRDSWRLAMEAVSTLAAPCAILEYAIWLDELGVEADHPAPGEMARIAFPIGGVRQAKREAVAAHISQLGGLITDDPEAFVLSEATILRLTAGDEVYWRPCGAR
ncbi:PIG-L deacetylase family protein [Aureimonas populi]|uniref:PIG-L deacetylase family protein n=1 Tax=Aureimonas populi TaxID=1701758 RepID=A0ABW5CFZ6_9HYPH|nr:PIG-L family deacetylase [Aureimonas populi]